ncbi:unnamed protein product [Prorocentrum cordatum]|uniref:N-acetyltransferase domain-containing protein n=1 Tax=Prorocentrum cordatum TaxID=2364126 RepID=A0ABN9R815_9DINO|nr:unnamed protein product [Polarella glacialis]
MAAVVAACREAFHLGASSTLLIVQEANVRARRFYERVGFSDTGKSMTRGGRSFILIEYKNNKVAPAVALVEEQDAECLTAWLGAEDLAVQHAVDGEDFGRPISPACIRGFWSGFAQWCQTARSREALVHRVFVARVDGVACGHIEIGVLPLLYHFARRESDERSKGLTVPDARAHTQTAASALVDADTSTAYFSWDSFQIFRHKKFAIYNICRESQATVRFHL